MTMSLMIKAGEPRLEAIYARLQQLQGAQAQLFGWDDGRRAALLAYGGGAEDPFGWSNWMTKLADDPSTLLAGFEALELVTDEGTGSVLNATFLGAFSIGQGAPAGGFG